ncbi:MAG: aspartate/tyrosine/aromatic aminotransferase [Candidatus Hydrogenedentes bacterium]|nr:aspartate/tyrosine/aromatic aminotransferase [Candidatus Hydrogenedentota bacterium]
MLEKLQKAPIDPILGLTELFQRDPNQQKINLSVGVYKDNLNNTPIFNAVKKAERIILEKEKTKTYLPISGLPEFCEKTQRLVLGENCKICEEERVGTVQTVGGTSALRIFADFLRNNFGHKRIWIPDPTWENHAKIFQMAGHEVTTYPYYDSLTQSLNWYSLKLTAEKIPSGDVMLLHGCCHNPTGLDLDKSQWEEISNILNRKGILPLVDFAYQGLGDGLEEDAIGIRIMANNVPELFICYSFSKNFGLYNERCGALLTIGENKEFVQKALSQIKVVIRTNYSNPPSHGAQIINTILSDEVLKIEWLEELNRMCQRIKDMRCLLVEKLKEKDLNKDFTHILKQKGMFSYTGLSKEQVKRLREEFSIYIVESGRINVAGITTQNIDRLVDAIIKVI